MSVTPISMTPAAQEHVLKYLKANPDAIGLRLGVQKEGCSGYKYVFSYADKAAEDDHVFDIDTHLKVFIAATSFDKVKGSRIDYIKRGFNGFLRCLNPNETGSCGCGESFSVD